MLTSIIFIKRTDSPVWCYQSFLSSCKSCLFFAWSINSLGQVWIYITLFLHFHFQAIPVCGHVYNFPLQLCGIWCSFCQPSGQPHGSEPRSSGQEQGHPSWCYFTQRAVHWEVSVSGLYWEMLNVLLLWLEIGFACINLWFYWNLFYLFNKLHPWTIQCSY